VRRLRVVVSLLCLALCAALVVMWLRSYRVADRLHWPLTSGQSFVVASKQGRLAFVGYQQGTQPNQWKTGRFSCPIDDELAFPLGDVREYGVVIRQPMYGVPQMTIPTPGKPPGWATIWNGGIMQLRGSGLLVPYWSTVLLMTAIAAASYFRRPWQFGVRALLVAVTFLAVLLGVAAMLDRSLG
jgi:hypothetical protein